MDPILFVHGIIGSDEEYQPIIKYLTEKGADKFYQFNYKNRFGLAPIKVAAEELADFIAKNIKEDNINIVAMSQGGVVALTYLRFYKNINVNKIFTICTPHKGSVIAKVFSLRGLMDLRPHSKLLKELQIFVHKNRVRLYSIYTPFDLVVFPGWNARSKYGKKKLVFSPTHQATFSWPPVIDYIYKNLEY